MILALKHPSSKFVEPRKSPWLTSSLIDCATSCRKVRITKKRKREKQKQNDSVDSTFKKIEWAFSKCWWFSICHSYLCDNFMKKDYIRSSAHSRAQSQSQCQTIMLICVPRAFRLVMWMWMWISFSSMEDACLRFAFSKWLFTVYREHRQLRVLKLILLPISL